MNSIQGAPLSTLQSDDGLRQAIWISVGLHIAVAAMLTLRAVLYPSQPIEVEHAIHVDMVALPEKSQSLPQMTPAPIPVSQAPPPAEAQKPAEAAKPAEPKLPPLAQPTTPKINLNQVKREREAALKRIEAMQKIEHMAHTQPAKSAANAPVRGNQISKGNALTGIARLENERYVDSIDEFVKKNWDLPRWLQSAKLSARVRVYVDAQGRVIKREISRSSGNQIFDERAITAVDKSSPLPRPPSDLAGMLSVDGLELEFVPE